MGREGAEQAGNKAYPDPKGGHNQVGNGTGRSIFIKSVKGSGSKQLRPAAGLVGQSEQRVSFSPS